MLDGLIVVDKPAGWTSHDVVARVRRIVDQRRVGHAGTLDPDATGVLVVGLGRVTRLLRFVQETGKVYAGVIVLGVATDTLDASGAVLERSPMPFDRQAVERAVGRFVGELSQVPPMVSAVKVGGRRLYELARAGRDVEREARTVRVDRFEITTFEPGPYPEVGFELECSSGTYVRSLAADLGAALGGPAHLGRLRRTAVGPFTLDDAFPLDRIEEDVAAAVLPPREAVRHLAAIEVDDDRALGVANGAVFPCRDLVRDDRRGPFAVIGHDDSLLAVYERRGAALKPAVVLAPGPGGG